MPDTSLLAKRLVKFALPFQGLNTTSPSLVLAKGYASSAYSVRFSQGEISTMPAVVSLGTFTGAGSPINGAFTQMRASDNTVLSYHATNGYICIYTPNINTWKSITYVGTEGAILTDLPNTSSGLDEDFWSFAEVANDIFISNGVGTLLWSASGDSFTILDLAAPSVPYSARILVSFAGRLVLVNTYESGQHHEDRVRWSAAQSPTIFDPISDASAGANDIVDLPGALTGAIALGGRLFLHKRSGITVMSETGLVTPSFSFQTAVDAVGTIAPRTLLDVRGVQIFMGVDDIYAYDGASPPRSIGEPIRRELFAALNWKRVKCCWALDYVDTHEYLLFVATDTDDWPKIIYAYDYANNTWSRRYAPGPIACSAGANYQISPVVDTWDGGLDNQWNAADGVGSSDNYPNKDLWDAPEQVPHLVPFIGRSNGSIIRFDEAALALNETCSFETADWDCDRPGFYKTIESIRVGFRCLESPPSNLTVAVSGNGGVTWVNTGGGGPRHTPSGSPVGAIEMVTWHPSPRLTAAQFRIRIQGTRKFSVVSLEAEVIDRSEIS